MAKRITTDAKIVLERAGWSVDFVGHNCYGRPSFLRARIGGLSEEIGLYEVAGIKHGTVDNAEVERLLEISQKLGK